VDARLRAARDHDVRAAGLDHLVALGKTLGARGAGRRRGVDPGPCPQFDADQCRRTVRHEHRDGQRRHLAQAVLLEQVVLVEQRDRTADARADGDTETIGINRLLVVRRRLVAGVRPRLPCRDDRDLLAAVHPAQLHPGQDLGRLDGQRGVEPRRQVVPLGPFVVVDLDAVAAGDQAVPGGGDVPAQRRGRSDTGDDDFDRAHGLSVILWV
jgi:hypothetical protein